MRRSVQVVEKDNICLHPPTKQQGDPYLIQPLSCSDWDDRLKALNNASFFHTQSWAKVLHNTYGHRPIYFILKRNNETTGLLPVMDLGKWKWCRKGVSLPFSDSCPTLGETAEIKAALWECAKSMGHRIGWRTLEIRDQIAHDTPTIESGHFLGHKLDLTSGISALYENLSSAMKRGIRKAMKHGAVLKIGNQPEDFERYYDLHLLTRKKHGLPPQPYRFFNALAEVARTEGLVLTVSVQYHQRTVASAIVTQFHGNLCYKFGASDPSRLAIRPNNLLMWGLLTYGYENGYRSLDLGRTSISNWGMRRFKESLGAEEYPIRYYKYDISKELWVGGRDHAYGWHNPLFRHMPMPFLRLTGAILYPHLS